MRITAKNFTVIFDRLLAAYGAQGWWPVTTGRIRDAAGADYHPGRYDLPDSPAGRFEVAVGAVLTQNTSWQNVKKALAGLKRERLLSVKRIVDAQTPLLAAAIRPSGYYNEKAKKLKLLATFFQREKWLTGKGRPDREKLLAVWGIGPETADSILLYAFQQPFFVVDAYARRLLVRLGWIDERVSYAYIQNLFHRCVKRTTGSYNEYHALIVAHAKRHCRKSPICRGCPVNRQCQYYRRHRPASR